jgi:hypothetical protein
MRRAGGIAFLMMCSWAAAADLRADIGPISIPPFTTGLFPPYSFLAEGLPAGQTIHGIRLVGDWTAGTPDAWSAFFYMFPTSPGGLVGSTLHYGGRTDADPYHIDATRYLAIPQGVTSGGDWRFAFTMTFPGTTAQLSNVQVTLLDNPVASYSATTDGQPVWFHPHEGFLYVDKDELVAYHVQAFQVDTTGRYDIYSSHGYDGMVFLYADAFDPNQPLANGLADNDDGRTGKGSSDVWFDRHGAPLTLEAGRTYYLVTTGMQAIDKGPFTNYIGGVGRVTFVPEPGTLVLLAAGGLWRRPRRRRR